MPLDKVMMRVLQKLERYNEIWEDAYEYALQRAREEGDVNPDVDYKIIEFWEKQYFITACVNEGLDPYGSRYI